MDSIIFGIVSLLYVVLLIWLLIKHRWRLSSVLLFVLIALIYDNVILALGKVIGEGNILYMISMPRFWFHAFFTPVLIVFSLAVVREAGNLWAQKRWILMVVWTCTIIAIVFEYRHSLASLSLKAKNEFGAISYTQGSDASGPPMMIVIVVVALIMAGVILWWKSKWPWVFVGTLIMSNGSVLLKDFGSNTTTNAFELFLIFTLVWTKKRLDHNQLKLLR